MPVHFRRYFQLVEKKSVDVNPVWKFFHAFLFIVIVAASFIAASTFHDIFDSFNFHCILYAKPVLRLDSIEYFTTTSAPSNETDLNATSTSTAAAAVLDDFSPTTTATTPTVETNVIKEPENKLPKFDVIDDFYWLTNSTLKGRLIVDYRQTAFGSSKVCNSVLFFPLATVVLGTFVAVIVMMCGRGGKGYASDLFPQPWIYVYPLLIFSSIMLIINCVMANFLSKGMKQFCAEFSPYTGLTECSEEINYFTDESGFGVFNLYQTYRHSLVAFCTGIVMWSLQVALIVLRVVCIADFQLKMVTVSCTRKYSLDYNDPLNQVFKDSFKDLRKVVLVKQHYDDENMESSMTHVHDILTKTHKLKSVTFEDEKSDKDDDDVTQV